MDRLDEWTERYSRVWDGITRDDLSGDTATDIIAPGESAIYDRPQRSRHERIRKLARFL